MIVSNQSSVAIAGLVGIDGGNLLLREKDAAHCLAVTPRALQAWRRTGTGPAFVKISNRCIRYRVGDIKTWAADRVRHSTAEA